MEFISVDISFSISNDYFPMVSGIPTFYAVYNTTIPGHVSSPSPGMHWNAQSLSHVEQASTWSILFA
jgi:hypothetical protein